MATSFVGYFSSVVTGSITWVPSYVHVPSTHPFTGITRGALNDSLAQYKAYIETYIADSSSSALAAATIIWGWSGAGETDSGLEYMQCVLAHGEVLTVESLVQNVTMPFFAVGKFEWLQYYETELTTAELGVNLYDNLGPFKYHVNQSAQLGFLPHGDWGTNRSISFLPQVSLLVSETRTLVMRPPPAYCDMLPKAKRCKDNDTIPANVKRRFEAVGPWCDCFVYARVAYRTAEAEN